MSNLTNNNNMQELQKIKKGYENQYKFPYTSVKDKDIWVLFLSIQTGELECDMDTQLKCNVGEQINPLLLSKKMKNSFLKNSGCEKLLSMREQLFYKALKNFTCKTDLNDQKNNQITYLRYKCNSEFENRRNKSDEDEYEIMRSLENDGLVYNENMVQEFMNIKRHYDDLCVRYNYFEMDKAFLDETSIRTYFRTQYDLENALIDNDLEYIYKEIFHDYTDADSVRRYAELSDIFNSEDASDMETMRKIISEQLNVHLNNVFCRTINNFNKSSLYQARPHLVVCMFFMYVYSYYYPYCIFLEARENIELGNTNDKKRHYINLQARLQRIDFGGINDSGEFDSDVEIYDKIKEFEPLKNSKREFEDNIYKNIRFQYKNFVDKIEEACNEGCESIFKELVDDTYRNLGVMTWRELKELVTRYLENETIPETFDEAMVHFDNMVKLFGELESRMSQSKQDDIIDLENLLFYNNRDNRYKDNVKKKILISFLANKIKKIRDRTYGDVKNIEEVPASPERIKAMNLCIQEFKYFCNQIRIDSDPNEEIGFKRNNFMDLLGKSWSIPLSLTGK